MPTSPAERTAALFADIPSRSLYAVFHTSPSAIGDVAYVTVPTVDGGDQLCEVHWEPRVSSNGNALVPAAKAAAVVLDDEDGDWYVVWWDPAGAVELAGSGSTSNDPKTHNQIAAANPWVIDHNLGRYPVGLETFDNDGVKVEGDVKNTTLNQTTITFSGAMSGKATYI